VFDDLKVRFPNNRKAKQVGAGLSYELSAPERIGLAPPFDIASVFVKFVA
jgi:hypothetical protein